MADAGAWVCGHAALMDLARLAQALADHPWRSVAVSVVAVWLLGAAAWWCWRRAAPGTRAARVLAALGAMGAAAGVGLLWWAWPHAGGPVGRFDTALVRALADALAPQQLQVWGWLTHAGDARSLTALAAAVALWLWRRGDAIGLQVWLGGLAANGLSTRALKVLADRQRPLHQHGLAVVESGSSFPSGHASAAVVAWGLLAWLLARRLPAHWHAPLAMGATALVVVVGWSRVLLQVHHASDVLAGWLTGGAWLLLCVLLADCRGAPAWGISPGRRASRAPGRARR
jgi:membrane-associated phospholipid phosphatase